MNEKIKLINKRAHITSNIEDLSILINLLEFSAIMTVTLDDTTLSIPACFRRLARDVWYESAKTLRRKLEKDKAKLDAQLKSEAEKSD